MNLFELTVIAAALIGAIIGFFTCALFYGVKRHRVERDAWRQARIFYTHRADPFTHL